MLTRDLFRATVRDGALRLGFLRPKDHEHARGVLDAIRGGVGQRRADVEDALGELAGATRDHKIVRGLAKLALDRADFAGSAGSSAGAPAPLDPEALRALLFERAATQQPLTPERRDALLSEVAATLGATPQDLDAALYADLHAEARLVQAPDLTPEALVQHYDVALAQFALLGAKALDLRIEGSTPRRLRQLIRWLKFNRLLYTAEREAEGIWRFHVDGPLSIVDGASRYGAQLAAFFPALLLAPGWSLQADCRVGRARATLSLDAAAGLVSPLRDTGQWVAGEELALVDKLRELGKGAWEVTTEAPLLSLDGRGVVVPDLQLTHTSGRVAYIELVWRWRAKALARSWPQRAKAAPQNLVVAFGGGGDGALPQLPGPVLAFKHVPGARALLALCEQVAV